MLNRANFFKAWVVAAWFVLAGAAFAQPTSTPTDARQLWQLLDYVAVDYGGAVERGAVISQGEYAEMLDFTENAGKQAATLPEHPSKPQIGAKIADLRAAVVRKDDAGKVAELAHEANALILAAFPMPVVPTVMPDLARGKILYAQQCASCHGATGNGDGSLAASLDPKPIAFTDAERARARSLLALYQVVTQGVEGTSMPAFTSLSESDRWALAFYIGTMSHDDGMRQRGERLWSGNDPALKKYFADLTALTTSTEVAAAGALPPATARDTTAYLRNHPSAVDTGKTAGVALSRARLKESLVALRGGDRTTATRLSLSAYLDGFEPIEPIVGARDSRLLVAVEDAMLAYRAAVSSGTVEHAEGAAVRLEQLFSQVDAVLADAKADPMSTFLGALTILLREGVEALLIVIGIIAVLKKANRTDVLRHVHAGWVAALLAGALTWWVATYMVDISGASREVTEGVGAVLAALVLLSVGLWMHQKSSAGRWQEYLQTKLSNAMSRRSAWALFALSFVAVYREVFETVLFYSALAADGNSNALAAGFFTALALLAVIAWVMLRTSARMPLGKFFSVTSVFVAVLAVVLIGKGASALQEAGWLSVTPLGAPRIELLGLHPTLETVAAQVLVALIAFVGFGLNRRNAGRHSEARVRG
jgi:high-affinity iron transporter